MSYYPVQNGYNNHAYWAQLNAANTAYWAQQASMYSRRPDVMYNQTQPYSVFNGPPVSHQQQQQPPPAHQSSKQSSNTARAPPNTNKPSSNASKQSSNTTKPASNTTKPSNQRSSSSPSDNSRNVRPQVDIKSYVPKLQTLHNMGDDERLKHRDSYKKEYKKLCLDDLTKVKTDISVQLKQLKGELEKKQKEIQDLQSAIERAADYHTDICQAITFANNRLQQRKKSPPPQRRAAAEVPERNVRREIRNSDETSGLSDPRTRPRQPSYEQQKQQQHHQEQQRHNDNNRNKRARYESPPRSNLVNGGWSTSTASNRNATEVVTRSDQFKNAVNNVCARLQQTQPIVQKQQPHRQQEKSVSPPNAVQSRTVTSTKSPVDGYMFVNFTLKFVVENVIVKPQVHCMKVNTKTAIRFALSDQQFKWLQGYKNDKTNPELNRRLVFRMSTNASPNCFDYLMTKIKITVNDKVPLYPGEKKHTGNNPKPKKPPIIEAPLDISEECWDKPTVEIIMDMEGEKDDISMIVVGVYFIRLISVEESIRVFNEYKGARKVEDGLDFIGALLKDSGVVDETLPVSLTCPISKQRMETPCIGISCNHYKCFDLTSFLQIHSKTYLWRCPICDKVINSGQIIRDSLINDLLKRTKPSCLEVTFHRNGRWVPVENAEESTVDVDILDDIILSDDDD